GPGHRNGLVRRERPRQGPVRGPVSGPECSQGERGATWAEPAEGRGRGPSGVRAVSEPECSQGERGATRAEPAEGRGRGPSGERAVSEPECSQGERGATRAEPAEGRGRVRPRSGRSVSREEVEAARADPKLANVLY